ncbi:SCO7613 C-terminal domain-containing membrane protein [Micromonospora sp. NPDC020750]|uniref:SCO7613 C-terminal domain-containing membrane protein n=1 Tax=unclassified Micromonospora TaxID=2617518 RepID=UPI0037AD7444
MDTIGYPCPGCGTPADLRVGCRRCGRPPDPAAAEVIRLDREIVRLAGRAEQARRTYLELAGAVRSAQTRRAELAARVRAATPVGAPRQAAPPPAGPAVGPGRPVPAPAVGPARPVPVPAVGPARPVPVPAVGPAGPLAVPAVWGAGPVPAGSPGPVPPQRPAPAAPVGGAEASTRTVQGLLFVLGGLLLGTAAVVFTAVAWAAVGVVGRALILLAFTVLALAVPPLLARRGLRGTAETFAAVGLLLVVLDGYAAWSVDLFGVTGWSAARYAALVGGAGAALAAGYGRLTRLAVPWFAALLTVQPVLPLLAAPARPSAAGWTLVFVGVAGLNLAVVAALRGPRAAVGPGPAVVPGAWAGPVPVGVPAAATGPVLAGGAGPAVGGPAVVATAAGGAAVAAGRVLAWLGHGVALAVAAGCALVPLALGRVAGTPLLAGGPLLLVALTLLGAALVAGGRLFRAITAGAVVPVLALALLRPVAELRPNLLTVATALIALALVGAVRPLPRLVGPGPRVGALVVATGAAHVAALLAVVLGAVAVGRALPPWRGVGAGPDLSWGWQVPVAVVLAAVALAALLPRVTRPVTGVVAVAFGTLALTGVGPVPWPAVPAADLVVGAALLLYAVTRARPWWEALVAAVAGGALIGHALLVGLATPAGEAVLLGAVVLLGTAVAARGRRATGVGRGVAGAALAAALPAFQGMVAVACFAAGAAPWWQARAALAAVGLALVGLLAVRRWWPELTGYASTAFAVGSALAGLAPLVVRADEPVALYAALAVLLTVLAGPGAPRVAGLGLLVVALLAAAPAVVATLVAPHGGPALPWSGAPAGGTIPGSTPAGVALLLLTLAAALAARSPHFPGKRGHSAFRAPSFRESAGVGREPAGAADGGVGGVGAWLSAVPFAAAALPVLLAAAGTPWPVVPAVLLLTGLAALLVAALAGPRPLLVPVTVPVGLVATAFGLAGLLATRAGTLAGLGALVVVATMVAVGGRAGPVRLGGALVAVGAATGFAVTAALAASLPLRSASFAVLAVAVLVLAAAALPAGRDPARGPALDVAAQAVALLAVLLAGGSPRHAAAVCVLWGVAVGLRLLRRGEPTGRRWAFAGVAGGSELLGTWLLLGAGGVVLLEAYTLPTAGVALAAGVVALRTRPGLNSWLALGPGLAAALLPGLVSVLFAPEPQPWRRLLLGTGALAVVLAGSARRWQAPVLLGGITLALLALHELVRSWDLLPRWIFLAVGGLALIGLAATYERRRRDLARLRAVVGRMG